jgi:hypothetical protein
MVSRTILFAFPLILGALSGCAPELPPQVVSSGSLPRNSSAEFVLVGQDGKPADPTVEGLRECLISAGMTAGTPPRYAVQLSRTIRQRGTRIVMPEDKSEAPRHHLRHMMQADAVSVTALASGAEVYRLSVTGRIKPGMEESLGLAGNPVDRLFCQTIGVQPKN